MGKMECHGATHQGFDKQINEDQFVIADVRKTLEIWQTSLALEDRSRINGNSLGKLLAVADGTGKPESATRASVITIDRLIDFALNQFNWNSATDVESAHRLRRELIAAFWCCQESIVHEAEVLTNALDRDMASSLTLAVVTWPALHIASVGTCGSYRFRGEKLEPLTGDRANSTKANRPDGIHGNESTAGGANLASASVVGGIEPELTPNVNSVELAYGDTILLCTDGLTQHLPAAQIAAVLSSPFSAADCCDALINESLIAGGHDNITVVVGRFLVEDVPQMMAKAESRIAYGRSTEATAASFPPSGVRAVEVADAQRTQ